MTEPPVCVPSAAAAKLARAEGSFIEVSIGKNDEAVTVRARG